MTTNKTRGKWIFCLPLLFLFVTLGCHEPSLPLYDSQTPPSGMGSFYLQIAEVSARTILPDTTQDDFKAYRLMFVGEEIIREDRTASNYGDQIYLPVGNYNLTVTAYLDTAMEKPAAQGSANDITISAGTAASRSITLTALIGTDAGSGTFAWTINFPSEVTTATMKIIPIEATGTIETTVNLLSGNNNGTTLSSGYYRVLFTFEMPDVKTLVWLEALHIYQNMESRCERNFGEEYFVNNVYTVTFDYNYSGGITEGQSVIHGDTVTEPSPEPTRTGYDFGGWFTDVSCTFPYNFDTQLINNLTLYAKWYLVNLVVSGNSLTDKLNWIAANAVSGVEYIVEVEKGEDIAPRTLFYSGINNITINLRGIDLPRTIGLLSNGSMFTVGSGVTLVLGDNITLQGRSENNASLLMVNSGGTLITNTGSRITGNTAFSSSSSSSYAYVYGGGVYVNSGTFTMNGGEISGNTSSYSSSSYSYAYVYGGGVYVNSGTFTINGGEISGNTVSSDNVGLSYFGGGGVYVNSGTFTMKGGEISGNTVSSDNVGLSYVYGGGVGVSNNSTFTMSDGVISGNTGTGVYVSGTFTMSDGVISGNTSNGVYVYSGTFTMSDGVISSNTGHGVQVLNSNSTFTMNGGEISGNTSNGVSVNSSTFTMSDGVISSNTGHGVSVHNYSTFTMNGGEISGNTVSSAASYGGGVGVSSNSTFTMNGGEISGNTASSDYSVSSSGGGVGVSNNSTFTMNGGEISGNTVSSSYYYSIFDSDFSYSYFGGGGVYVNSGTFTMNGGEISGNTVSSPEFTSTPMGGGVHVYSGTFTMNGGEISGNTASFYGGGVCARSNSTFTMSGGIIYGINSTTELMNLASSGRAFYNSSSSAEYGILSNGIFSKRGDLVTTDNTIQVVNGVLYTP